MLTIKLEGDVRLSNNGQLGINSTIKVENEQSVKALEYLGEDGQGYVYKVDYNGSSHALKWYKKNGFLDDINDVYISVYGFAVLG